MSFSNNFIAGVDDDWGIYENKFVQNLTLDNLKIIWFNQTFDTYYIPLTFTSFAIDIHFWGNQAIMFKYSNLMLFTLSCILLCLLLKTFSINNYLIIFSAAIFLIHPLQIETIALATGRRQILSILFLIISLLFLHKSLKGHLIFRYFFISMFAYFLSLSSKPASLFFYPVILLVILRAPSEIKAKAKILLAIFPSVITIFILWMNYEASQRNFLEQDFDYSFFQHILIITSSFGFYLKQFFLGPYTFFYPLSSSFNFDYRNLIFNTLLFIAFIAMVSLFLKRNKKLGFAALGWYTLSLILPSLMVILASDFPMNTADRYFIYAGPSLFLIIGLFVYEYLFKYKYIILVAIFSIFSIQTIKQIPNWDSSIAVFEHSLKHYPTKEIAHRLAIMYFTKGDTKNAIKAIEKATTLNNGVDFNNHAHHNVQVATIYSRAGKIEESNAIIFNSFKSDLEFSPNQDADSLIENKIKDAIPLVIDIEKNAHWYYNTRASFINNHLAKLKEKRI
jgi:hypothetical protein